MKYWLTKFIRETDGQDLIEYALLAATIAMSVFAGMKMVTRALNSEFVTIARSVTAS